MTTNAGKRHGLDSCHPSYVENEPDWCTIRDVVAGQRAVQAKGDRYLPMLDTDNQKVRESYVKRAQFFGATSRTMDGYMGSVFRKPPAFTVPPQLDPLVKNADGAGTIMEQFAKTLVSEVIQLNRAGVLLDLPPEAPANAVPYLCMYRAEDIHDWRVEAVNDKQTLTMVVLAERDDAPDENGFGHSITDKRRVLRLDTTRSPAVYTVEVWAKSQDEWVIVQPRKDMLVRGKAQEAIPFWFFSDEDLLPNIKKSAILDLANTNISHYQNSADIEHGAHYTALPTPWISGFSSESNPGEVPLGPTECIVLPPDGEAGMLEFTGAGLKALENRLEAKEKQMSVLGARILMANKTGVEAAETERLRQSADKSVLSAVVGTCNIGLQDILTRAYVWATSGEPAKDAIKVAINDEFFETALTGAEVLALVQSWQSGGFSRDSLLRKLQKGGMIERGPEEEVEQMESENGLIDPTKLPANESAEDKAAAAAKAMKEAGGPGGKDNQQGGGQSA